MRNRALKVRRRAVLAAAGILAAGALSGCRGGGAPFAHTGVARGDSGAMSTSPAFVHTVPTSPAFAQVAAGQRMAADPKGMMAHVSASHAPAAGTTDMVAPGTPLTMAAPQPIAGSGGLVYPVSFTQPGGQMMMSAPAPSVPGTTYPTMAMPTTAPQPVMMAMPMPGAAPMHAPTGQPTMLLIQGPNGPQYIVAEVIGTIAPAMPTPTPMPVPAATMPTPMPILPPAPPMPPSPPAPPTPVPAAASLPVPLPAPIPVPAPAAASTAAPVTPASSVEAPAPMTVNIPLVDSSAAPTTSPNAAALPMPAIPPAPAPEPTNNEPVRKAPDPLPPEVNAGPPSGPILPASAVSDAKLGTFPAAPVPGTAPAVKLPPATGTVEGEIPSAPVFLPAPPR